MSDSDVAARLAALELAFEQLRAKVQTVLDLEEAVIAEAEQAVQHGHQELTDDYASDTARKVVSHLAGAFKASRNDDLRAVGEYLLKARP